MKSYKSYTSNTSIRNRVKVNGNIPSVNNPGNNDTTKDKMSKGGELIKGFKSHEFENKGEGKNKQKVVTPKRGDLNSLNMKESLKEKALKGKDREKIPNSPKSVKREKLTNRKRGDNMITTTFNGMNKENNKQFVNSPRKYQEDQIINASVSVTRRKVVKAKMPVPKKDSARGKSFRAKIKNRTPISGEGKKTDKHKYKKSKSVFNTINQTKVNAQHSNNKLSDYSENESVLENISIEHESYLEESKQKIKEKVLEKYRDIFKKYEEELCTVLKSEDSEEPQEELTRSCLNNIMNIALRCSEFTWASQSALMILLDRMNRPEMELLETEKANVESVLRMYGNRFMTSYKIVFKIHYKKAFKETNENSASKKELFKKVRMKMKNTFLLYFEIVLNIIGCILQTVYSEDDKIYYIHLKGQLYKLISDVSETGVKYKYEKLAQESYEEALVLADVHLKPTNMLYLNLVNNYIHLLYFTLVQEREALDICVHAFDKASNSLEELKDEEEIDKCLQILSRMRYNIKKWTKKINKNSLLFLNF